MLYDLTVWGWVILVVTHLYAISVGFVWAIFSAVGGNPFKDFIIATFWPVWLFFDWLSG